MKTQEHINSGKTSADDQDEKKYVYWCSNCDVPLIQDKCANCKSEVEIVGTSLKPVFAEEYSMFKEIILSDQKLNLKERNFPWVLFRRNNYLFSDTSKGKPYLKFKISDKNHYLDALFFSQIEKERDFFLKRSRNKKETHFLKDKEYLEKLIPANLSTLERIEKEAISFIKSVIKEHPRKKIVSSFSGGKDSLVTTFLLSKSVDEIFDIVYSDTLIDFKETTEYIENYISKFGNLVHLKAKREFFELCDILGPPSRMMRWCCFTQKGAPINDYYSRLKGKVLSFDGIRSDESRLRKDYPKIKENTKIRKQLSVYPILNWSELEVWLYIMWRELEYNSVYDKGFSRCGCWACPNNSHFDWFLLKYFYPEMHAKWFRLLTKYSTGEDRYDESWIWDGDWKSRKVQYKDEIAGNLDDNNDPFSGSDYQENVEIDIELNEKKICLENNDFLINLDEIVTPRIIEFLKPFGKLSIVTSGNKQINNLDGEYVKIKIPINSKVISIEVLDELKFPKIKRYLERQIIKAMNCIDCAACTNSCSRGAINFENGTFQIIESICNNCLECCTTKYLGAGCVALHYKSKRRKLEK